MFSKIKAYLPVLTVVLICGFASLTVSGDEPTATITATGYVETTVNKTAIVVAPTSATIKAKDVERDNAVWVSIVESGGEPWVHDVQIDPEPKEGNSNHLANPLNFWFVGKPGIYTIRYTGVGQDDKRTIFRTEARVTIKDSRPRVPPPEIAVQPGPISIEKLVRKWVDEVESDEKQKPKEIQIIVKAAHDTVDLYRDEPRLDRTLIADKWEKAAYKELGPALKNWTFNQSGPSFFKNVNDLFADNSTDTSPTHQDEIILLEGVASFIGTK